MDDTCLPSMSAIDTLPHVQYQRTGVKSISCASVIALALCGTSIDQSSNHFVTNMEDLKFACAGGSEGKGEEPACNEG